MSWIPANNEMLLHEPGRGWLHFTRPLAVLQARALSEVRPALAEIERQVERGRFAAGFLSYEAAPAFDPVHVVRLMPDDDFPLLWFGIYPAPELLRVQPPAGSETAGGCPGWQPDVSQADYQAALAEIKAHIAAGHTYQVNYTYRLRSAWSAAPYPFFALLAAAHTPPYAAYLETSAWAIASLSPELFFTLDGETLTGRPMKGTAPRGRLLEDDQGWAEWLYHSEKNRAENVMIVDMVRNDLGRIARTGSVRVPELFKIEKYSTVWQMTSTVQAETGAGLEAIFEALFPCASITGAPKIRTMQIIAALERSPRRIYCGAIGYYAPGRRAQFNVAIRTLRVDRRAGQAEYGVGGGIVWDSQVEEEWRETQSKARVLVDLPQPFDLLETLRWSPGEGWRLLEQHLQRLERSAAYFDFPFERAAVVGALERSAEGFALTQPQRVRLTLSRCGEIALEHRPVSRGGSATLVEPGSSDAQTRPYYLGEWDEPGSSDAQTRPYLGEWDEPGSSDAQTRPYLGEWDEPGSSDAQTRPYNIARAKTPVHSTDRWLYHKTTRREAYQRALAEVAGAQDALLFNERGEVTESTIANLVYELDGGRYTPPVECGLLPGTQRAALLAQGWMVERPLRLEELPRCTRLWLANSVRGVWQVTLINAATDVAAT